MIMYASLISKTDLMKRTEIFKFQILSCYKGSMRTNTYLTKSTSPELLFGDYRIDIVTNRC